MSTLTRAQRAERKLEARAFVQWLAGVPPKRWFRHCAYCGRHCYGLTCATHRDLLERDPNYREGRQR